MAGLEITGIKFNYGQGAGLVKALSIRQNFTTDVAIPEWVKGKTHPTDSPVAYSITTVAGKIITIQASFTADSEAPARVEVRADGGGILGAIDPATMDISAGSSFPQFITLGLVHHQIGPSGILVQDVQWDWFYKADGGSWVSIGSSSHRIYVVLDTPFSPWLQPLATAASATQIPWADALDYACFWAKGELNPLDAATAVTRAVNSNLGLTYDVSHGASKYTQAMGSASWFLCTAFLAYLDQQPESKGNVVNCTDCATIVTSFANLLGCQLAAAVMTSPGGFLCNKIIPIGGGTVWSYPFPPANRFAYHEVAWTGAFSYGDQIFDACLLADQSGDPWDWTDPNLTHSPVLPAKEIFTNHGNVPDLPIPTPVNVAGYRERLAQNSAAGIGRCVPNGSWPNARGGRRSVF